MRKILGMVAAATTALAACGGGDTTDQTASSTSSGAGAGGDVSTASSSSTSGVGGGQGQVCPANTLCVQVKQVDSGTLAKGRLGIAWYPFDDANPTPPLIAYDVPFDPATVRFDIPYQALAPVTDALLLCPRSCMDPAMCPCMGDPALGFALVGVGQDTNNDGKLDAAELEATLYGVGRLGVVFSQKAYHPSPAALVGIFPEGINVGTHGYRIIPKSVKSSFDQLGIAFDGTVFDLAVCSGAPGCVVPTPNLH